MEKHLCTDGKIWDLHIHSCKCSSCDPTTAALGVSAYIDALSDIFERNPLIEMISFTDHNQIDYGLNSEYNFRQGLPQLVPGIEVDVKLEEGGVSKHLVSYFDAMGDDEKIRFLSDRLNAFMEDNGVGPQHPIGIDVLLNKFLDLKIPFVLSPHVLKQGKRSIDYE